jgi:alpha-beta hydrolase superfamily lysophospholipase
VVTATARWFGPADRPLFGWFHLPDDGRPRCWTVLCPPLGYEAASAHFGLRKLADRLAASGVAVLRFDYDGTGDSAGRHDDPDRLEAWRASVRVAIDAARRTADIPVVVAGLRVGAALAVLGAGDAAVDGLVLWDPCARGRAFLREEKAIMHIVTSEEVRTDGGVETVGYSYEPHVAADLVALDITAPRLPAIADRVLVLWRPERSRDKRLMAALADSGATVEHGVAYNQDELFMFGGIDEDTLTQIVRWTGTFDGRRVEVGPEDLPGSDTHVLPATGAGALDVAEHAVRLGPVGLFGVLAEPRRTVSGPTVIFFNFGINHHEGPGGLWVTLSRRWAAQGIRCLRVDRSGVGDSPVRPGQDEQITYPPEAIDDAKLIASAVSPDDPSDVVLIGVCSGAYLSVETGIHLAARGVCAINPVVSFTPAEHWTGQADPGRQAVRSKRRWLRGSLAKSELARRLKPHIPWRFWWLLHGLRIQRAPGSGLEPLVQRGVDTLVICDALDAVPYRDRSSWVLDRMQASGRFRFEVFPGPDHLMVTRGFREYAQTALTEHVLSHFAPPLSAAAPLEGAAEAPSREPETSR